MSKIKANFGCFSSGIPGWINIDKARRHIIISKVPGLPKLLGFLGLLRKPVYDLHRQKKFKGLIYGDVRRKLKIKNNSVDYIYSANMLEHLYPWKARFFLSECLRILKKGGVVRLVLPDIEYEAKQYLKSLPNPKSANCFSKLVYATLFAGGYKNNHKWMYDKYSLTQILKEIGFSNITVGEPQKGNFPDVTKLDVIDNSLILEGTKLNSEKADGWTCTTKHVIPSKSKDSGILPNLT